MNRKLSSLALILAAALSAPAFAESVGDGAAAGAGSSGSGSPGGVSMGSSGATSPSAATPFNAMSGSVASSNMGMRGFDGTSVLASAPNTTVLGGPGVITTYTYLNAPANVEQRADFQRWLRLN